MIYITENEALLNNESSELEQPAPVVEKVSLDEIRDVQQAGEIEDVAEIVKEYLELTPEEREAVRRELFK